MFFIKDDEDKAYQKLMSITGNEKIFVLRLKTNRYQVSRMRSSDDYSDRVNLES